MPNFASLPLFDPGNPFLLHWIYAMEEKGWHAQPLIWWPVSLFKHRKRIPVIVFHFPNSYWRSPSAAKTRLRALAFRLMVRLAKAIGYKMVWAANNAMPHDPKYPELEIAQRRWILRHFDLVAGFARNTRRDLEAAVGPFATPFVEGVHGHYEGLYPATAPVPDLIRRHGLDPAKFRLLLVLSDKPYKGQIPFLEAWVEARTEGLQLVLAGPAPGSMLRLIESLPGDVVHVSKGERIPHYVLGDLHRACDMVALPYLRITTSGAYFLALTLDRPVLAPDLPFFRMHTGEGKGVALLYDHAAGRPAARDAISRLACEAFAADAFAMAALREQFTWGRFAESAAPAFDALLGNRR